MHGVLMIRYRVNYLVAFLRVQPSKYSEIFIRHLFIIHRLGSDSDLRVDLIAQRISVTFK